MILKNFYFLQFLLHSVLTLNICVLKIMIGRDFPGGAVVKNPPANAGDVGLSPGLGRSHMLWSN